MKNLKDLQLEYSVFSRNVFTREQWFEFMNQNSESLIYNMMCDV